MKDQMPNSNLIWKYVDGECTPAEISQIESAARRDPEVRRAIAEAEMLHLKLQKQETEAPSMRFVQNVMEALPPIYRKYSSEPLLNPSWIKAFYAFLAVFLITYIWMFAEYARGDNPEAYAWMATVESTYESILGQLFGQSTVLIAALGISIILLYWVDRRLKNYFAG